MHRGEKGIAGAAPRMRFSSVIPAVSQVPERKKGLLPIEWVVGEKNPVSLVLSVYSYCVACSSVTGYGPTTWVRRKPVHR